MLPENDSSSNLVTLGFPDDAKKLYLSYGIKNGTQAYAGATLEVFTAENKPAFVPLYSDGAFVCIVYIYVETSTKTIKAYQTGGNTSNTLLIRCYSVPY